MGRTTKPVPAGSAAESVPAGSAAVTVPSTKGLTRAQRAEVARRKRARRHDLARKIADGHDGVVTRQMLLEAGLTRGQIQVEVERGVWVPMGRHTLGITSASSSERASWWRALWESGGGAVLDGPTALFAIGLKSWSESSIHVTVPNARSVRPLRGVTHHRLRDIGPVVTVGLRRTKPEVAVIRAAQWAKSDAQAATFLAMAVQQRLVAPSAILHRWGSITYSARRGVLDDVIRDVCDGAHSLGELDFARECRQRGLPEPSRQVVRTSERGTVYLDVFWDEFDVHVEIQGAHHFQGLAAVSDALRFNDIRLNGRDVVSLQVPVLGLRTGPEPFFTQIKEALRQGRERRSQ